MFGALLDACVLVPVSLADTLLRLADREIYRPLWSEKILDETRTAVLRIHPDMDPSRMDSRIRSMNEAFPDASVSGWEPLLPALELPDPNDAHVMAAALRGRADVIVTHNLSDFPADVLEPLGLSALSPDQFLLDQLDLAPALTLEVVQSQASDAHHPTLTVDDVLNSLARAGASEFAKAARAARSH